MKVLVTGANGFIGKNLVLSLQEKGFDSIMTIGRKEDPASFEQKIYESDIIFHLAGVNRPDNGDAFQDSNIGFTNTLISNIIKTESNAKVIFSSSTQALNDTKYGESKLECEKSFQGLCQGSKNSVLIYRIPGVFGKWCKPNYNSVVSTFCFNLINNIPSEVIEPDKKLNLVYIDDLVRSFLSEALKPQPSGVSHKELLPTYEITVGDLYKTLEGIKECRKKMSIGAWANGLHRALYATYLSFVGKNEFVSKIEGKADQRGIFSEVFKTKESGQFSYFTILPGFSRGSHYHHTKSEKFLLLQGKAVFKFKNIVTLEEHIIHVEENDLQIVDSVPGWVHEVQNTSDVKCIFMLWSSEIFDSSMPDTFFPEVSV